MSGAQREPAFHALTDRALWDQARFWSAQAAGSADKATVAFAAGCAREIEARGLDPDVAPAADAVALRARLADLAGRATPVHIGSTHLAIHVTRAELYDLQALAWLPEETTHG